MEVEHKRQAGLLDLVAKGDDVAQILAGIRIGVGAFVVLRIYE